MRSCSTKSRKNALAWSVSLVDERVIDEINILQATYRAMKQAVDGLTRPADFVYVDGNRSQGLEQPHECRVSGDAKNPVCCGSVHYRQGNARDRLMRRFAEQYPQYGFEKHKGYETKAHDEALLEHGPCPIHPDDLPSRNFTKSIRMHRDEGRVGEKAARLYLESAAGNHGSDEFPHPVWRRLTLSRRTRSMLSLRRSRRAKRSATVRHAKPSHRAKQAKIIAAAQAWLQEHPTEKQPRFDVIEVYGEKNASVPPRINHLENAFGG